MKSLNINSKKGFTIIEVVLVLAIAGLIFLMVFIALPNMQSAQRNRQRQQDYSNFSTMITTYVGNNNGKMPTADNIKKEWFNSTGMDTDGLYFPDADTTTGAKKKITISACSSSSCYTESRKPLREAGKQVVLFTSATCEDGVPKYAKSGPRTFVIYGYYESGNNVDSTYCLASHA